MKIKKFLLVGLALLLLLVCNFAVLYGCFFRFVYRFAPQQPLAQLDGKYQDAVVLSVSEQNAGVGLNRYILAETAFGETHLLALQGSQYFRGRYHYLPDRTLLIPEERPYSVTARTMNEAVRITIDAQNQIELHEGTISWPTPLDSLYSHLPLALLAVELLLWLAVRRRRERAGGSAEAAENTEAAASAGTAARTRQKSSAEAAAASGSVAAIPALNRLSLRSGVGHPAQRVRPRQVLVPIAVLLALAVIGFAAIFFGFKWFVFNFEYSGDPSSLGEEYRGAEILSDSNMTGDQRLLELQTASGEVRYLVLESFPALYPGRYHYPPRQAEVVFRQSTESFRIRTASLDVQVDVMNGEALSRSVMSGSSNVWMEAEFILAFVWLVILVGLAVWYARRIEPKRQAPNGQK